LFINGAIIVNNFRVENQIYLEKTIYFQESMELVRQMFIMFSTQIRDSGNLALPVAGA
jgi:hypothetical protein